MIQVTKLLRLFLYPLLRPHVTALCTGLYNNFSLNLPLHIVIAETLAGTWEGYYTCDGKQFTLQATLALKNGDPNSLTGKLTFLNSTVKGVEVVSVLMTSGGSVQFSPVSWETQPAGVSFLGLTGMFNSATDQITGTTTLQNCESFNLTRGGEG